MSLVDVVMANLEPCFTKEQRLKIKDTLQRIQDSGGSMINPREELFPLVLALRQIRRDQLHMQQAQEEVAALVAERMRALGWTHAGFTDVGFATIEKDGTLTFAPLES